MGSGAIIAAALARADPARLAVHASILVVAFNIAWLVLYWRLADRAGLAVGWHERLSEALWLATSLAFVITATAILGPETAMLTAYGPMIILRYLVDERPDRRKLSQAFRRMLPFGALIGWLVATRLFTPLEHILVEAGRLQPFAGTPAWSPFFHAGTWLVVAAVLTGLLRGHARSLPSELRAAWNTGRLAAGLAQGLFQSLGSAAVVLMPIISAVYGALANSSNAANGLFMAAQVSLAIEAGLNLEAVIALQHAAALSLNMVSPVRMSIACGLAGTPGRERDAYRAMLPFALATVALLLVASILVAIGWP
jgi:lactate permease